MAVSALVRLSEDKVIRQAYQRRQDDLMLQNRKDRKLSELEASIAKKDAILAEKDAILVEKEASIAEKDAIIAKLRSQLAEK